MRPQLPAGIATGLVDLHIHVGGAVAPHTLYSMAHEQGFKLPVRSYWEFVELVTSRPDKVKSLEDYIAIMHQWTERIQSSPAAMERSVYEIIAKEYRSSSVERIELRFNPMKRNVGGEKDLDVIILASLIGMKKACLAYGVEAGLIFCLAREFEPHLNSIIVDKAIKYRAQGVVGIDLAGPESESLERDSDHLERYAELFARARDAGLGTTIHTGETPNTDARGVLAVLKHLRPDRIGHGIRAAYDDEVMAALKSSGVVLELCPTSNLHTRAVSGLDELRTIIRTFLDREIPITINTDGPYLLQTNLRRELDMLLDQKIMTPDEVIAAMETASGASFLPVST